MVNFSGVRNNSGVSEDALRKYVPSLFAEEAHESRSDRYVYIPTWDTLSRMVADGFVITSAQQARTRDIGKRDFTKHLVRLRHARDLGKAAVVGDSVFELILKNAHDGSSCYELMAGIFRFVCANGMVVSEAELPPLKVRHSGNITDNVIDASYEIIEEVPRIASTIEQWRNTSLGGNERLLLANEAIKLRFDVESESQAPINAQQALALRRYNDNGTDLWSTFNTLQENLVKGGMVGRKIVKGVVKRREVRAVKGIDQDTRLNKGLWSLAQKMQELKVGNHVSGMLAKI